MKKSIALGKERLFVSRYKAQFRRIQNEEEVERYYSRFGFRKMMLEDMNFLDQVAAFESAEVVVSPHGAGLANLAFASSGVSVIEVFNEFYSKVFWSLGALIGCRRYDVVKCRAVDNGREFYQQHDLHVDVEGLGRTLSRALRSG